MLWVEGVEEVLHHVGAGKTGFRIGAAGQQMASPFHDGVEGRFSSGSGFTRRQAACNARAVIQTGPRGEANLLRMAKHSSKELKIVD